MSIEKFGLRLIPFKSQGSESGKYPFVSSDSFNELISEIEKIRQQKDSGAIIVRGPQGSGKTATRNGLVNSFSTKSDVALIPVTLSSVDLRDLAWSIIDSAKEQSYVTSEFLQKIGYVEGTNIERPNLEKIITKVIEETLSKYEFGILIIDEFDIISQPSFHDTNDQTIFLHNITNILNNINESKIIQEKSFCTILAQTEKSSEDFHDYITTRHGPLSSRLKKNIDIKYNFNETKEIIKKRIDSEQISGFLKPEGNSLFPLDEEIIKYLYDQINQSTQTSSMIAFRDMEQILHDSIEQALAKGLPKVEISIVKEIFDQNVSKLEKKSKKDTRRISLETNNELTKVINDDDPSIANNLYLNGIKTAMKTWETGLYRNVDSVGASIRLIPNEENDVFISSIKIDLESNTKHFKSIIWYAASKKRRNEFSDNDIKSINVFLEKNKHEQNGCQFSILTVFEDHSRKNEAELQTMLNNIVDKIYISNNLIKQSIVGIELSSSLEERIQFREEWNTHLHDICTDKLGETLHDIDKEFKIQHKIIVQILYAKSILGEKLKRDDLKKYAIQISKSLVRDPHINDIITFGFSDEEFNALIPRNLYSIKNLIEAGKTGIELSNSFTKPFAIDAAKKLGIINEESMLNNIDALKKEITDDIFNDLILAVPENFTALSTNEIILKLLKETFEKIDEENNFFKKIIALNFIKEQGPKSLDDLSGNTSHNYKEETNSDTDDSFERETNSDTDDSFERETNSDTEVLNVDSDSVLKVCQEILIGRKLTLNELKKEISEHRGFEDQSKWVTLLFDLIHTQKLLLAIR